MESSGKKKIPNEKMRHEQVPHHCCRWDPGRGCICLCCPASGSHTFRASYFRVTNLPTGLSWPPQPGIPKIDCRHPGVYGWSADEARTKLVPASQVGLNPCPNHAAPRSLWHKRGGPCSHPPRSTQKHLPCTNLPIHFCSLSFFSPEIIKISPQHI